MPTQNFTPDQVRSFFDAHWTVRAYKSFAMPKEHLDTILHAAQRAPTDATAQMYSFIRLTDGALREKIAQATTNPHIATASESFVICADVNRLDQILKAKGYEPGTYPSIAIHFGIGDAVMAAQNMLVAAEMLGYRGCWIGGVLNALEDITKTLELPEGVFPFAAMTIGLPDEEPVHRPRLSRELVVHENSYHRPSKEELLPSIESMGPIAGRGDWAQMLNRYFGQGGTMEKRESALDDLLKRQLRGR
ncbi:MAG: NADPH-dependent oxidoreductase [Proteobacteria bacterium]|nr:MAG: NADPH-dependent oxidoreductase [Pseudomonadota bacterium]